MTEAGQRSRFPAKPPQGARIADLTRHYQLDGNFAFQTQVRSFVHRPHAALAESPFQTVSTIDHLQYRAREDEFAAILIAISDRRIKAAFALRAPLQPWNSLRFDASAHLLSGLPLRLQAFLQRYVFVQHAHLIGQRL